MSENIKEVLENSRVYKILSIIAFMSAAVPFIGYSYISYILKGLGINSPRIDFDIWSMNGFSIDMLAFIQIKFLNSIAEILTNRSMEFIAFSIFVALIMGTIFFLEINGFSITKLLRKCLKFLFVIHKTPALKPERRKISTSFRIVANWIATIIVTFIGVISFSVFIPLAIMAWVLILFGFGATVGASQGVALKNDGVCFQVNAILQNDNVRTSCDHKILNNGDVLIGRTIYSGKETSYFLTNCAAYEVSNKGEVVSWVYYKRDWNTQSSLYRTCLLNSEVNTDNLWYPNSSEFIRDIH